MSFNQEGFAAVRLTEWREDYNHQHQNVLIPPPGSSDPILGDLAQFVDIDYVVRVARLNAVTLATLASAPGQPRDVTIVTTAVENATSLTWRRPEGMAHGHFEVVWRATTAPDWQYVHSVDMSEDENVTVTLPISKDNVVFGVRAADPAGHRGPAVVP